MPSCPSGKLKFAVERPRHSVRNQCAMELFMEAPCCCVLSNRQQDDGGKVQLRHVAVIWSHHHESYRGAPCEACAEGAYPGTSQAGGASGHESQAQRLLAALQGAKDQSCIDDCRRDGQQSLAVTLVGEVQVVERIEEVPQTLVQVVDKHVPKLHIQDGCSRLSCANMISIGHLAMWMLFLHHVSTVILQEIVRQVPKIDVQGAQA
eukprot:4400913-Amphidinium_carterae.1